VSAVGGATDGPRTRAVVEAAQNKLAAVIVQGELALEMADGPVRERIECLLAAAWGASALLRELAEGPA